MQASSAQAIEQAIAGSVTERQAEIRAGYAKLRERLGSIEVEDAGQWKALCDAVLSLDKDQRVVDGGVSDRTAAAVGAGTEEAAEREMREMLDALAARTRGDDGAETKH